MQTGRLSVTDTYLGGCTWKPGTKATGVFSGQTTSVISSGRAEWKLYEVGVGPFVSSGAVDYFECSAEGCDPFKPIALNLTDPRSPTSGFTLSVPFTMVPKQKTGAFRIEFIAQDQDVLPYDLQVSLLYNYSDSSAPLVVGGDLFEQVQREF